MLSFGYLSVIFKETQNNVPGFGNSIGPSLGGKPGRELYGSFKLKPIEFTYILLVESTMLTSLSKFLVFFYEKLLLLSDYVMQVNPLRKALVLAKIPFSLVLSSANKRTN